MSEFAAKAEETLAKAFSRDEFAIDPATIAVVIQVITSLIGICKSRGGTQADAVATMRTGAARRRLRNRLRKDLGAAEYKARGGAKYADAALNAGATSKVTDIRGFVAEIWDEA